MKTSYGRSIRFVAQGGLIAALYTALTMLSALTGLASGAVQFRISEALCILCVFTPAAIPGLTIGCLISNLLTECVPVDLIFGTLATLIGAICTRLLRKTPHLSPLPYVLSNTVIIGLIMRYVYGKFSTLPLIFYFGTVGLGEAVCGWIGGVLVYLLVKKAKIDKYLN